MIRIPLSHELLPIALLANHVDQRRNPSPNRAKHPSLNYANQPIRSPVDHRTALKEIASLMTAKNGTPAGDRLDI